MKQRLDRFLMHYPVGFLLTNTVFFTITIMLAIGEL